MRGADWEELGQDYWEEQDNHDIQLLGESEPFFWGNPDDSLRKVINQGSLDDEPCVVGPKTEQPVKRKRSASASPSAEPEPKVACVKDGEEDGANPSPPPNPPGITKHVDKPTDPRKQAQQAVAKPNRRGQVSPVLRVCRVTGSETWFVLRDLLQSIHSCVTSWSPRGSLNTI